MQRHLGLDAYDLFEKLCNFLQLLITDYPLKRANVISKSN